MKTVNCFFIEIKIRPKYFFALGFFVLAFASEVFSQVEIDSNKKSVNPDCPEIEVTAKYVETTSGKYNVKFDAAKGVQPYRFIFYDVSGKLISKSFKTNEINSVPPGNYFLTVIDENNCKKSLGITLK